MSWLRRIRGAVGMGLLWALAWAIVGGGIMEALVDPHGEILDMWPQTLAIPGFLGGVGFSILLWMTEGHRRFDELSVHRFGALGALTGMLLGGFAMSMGAAAGTELAPWVRALVIIGPLTLMSTTSACGALLLARMAERRALLEAPR